VIIFDSFSDAAEEATWCAEKEKRKYIIKHLPQGYQVLPNPKGVKRYAHVEIGFKHASKEG
tara:strand:- start:407 stop:589 length:183 start_codon:yes stop_codon:yes gene_type:complete